MVEALLVLADVPLLEVDPVGADPDAVSLSTLSLCRFVLQTYECGEWRGRRGKGEMVVGGAYPALKFHSRIMYSRTCSSVMPSVL